MVQLHTLSSTGWQLYKFAKPEFHQKTSMLGELGELCERMKEVVELYRTVVHFVYAWLCHAYQLRIYSQHIQLYMSKLRSPPSRLRTLVAVANVKPGSFPLRGIHISL